MSSHSSGKVLIESSLTCTNEIVGSCCFLKSWIFDGPLYHVFFSTHVSILNIGLRATTSVWVIRSWMHLILYGSFLCNCFVRDSFTEFKFIELEINCYESLVG